VREGASDAAMTERRVLIIGGGIAGLSSAYRLREAARAQGLALSLTVAEAAEGWGGVTRSSRRDGFLLEHGPDAIIRIKPAGLKLIRDLGLEDRIQDTDPAHRTACILRRGRLLPVPDGLYLMAPSRFLPFAISPMISWMGKLRMGLDLFLPRRDPLHGEESLADFVRRRLGREALDRLAQPMVGGIYTADPERLSLDLAMPQFKQMEQDHRSLILAMRANRKKQAAATRGAQQASGPRYGLFISLREGLQELVDRLVSQLDDCDLRLGCPVAGVRRQGGVWCAQVAGEEQTFDAVLLCVPAYVAAELLAGCDGAPTDDLAAIEYGSVATLNLAFRRDQVAILPKAAGFVVPAVERQNLIACTFASQKFADRAPEGHVLLRAFIGGAYQPQQLMGDDVRHRRRAAFHRPAPLEPFDGPAGARSRRTHGPHQSGPGRVARLPSRRQRLRRGGDPRHHRAGRQAGA
jgi:oxygen-dependent protoporphyrinogen oxidase